MGGGYMGRILCVDLLQGRIHEEALDKQVARQFIGGYGLGARILYSRQNARVDSLGPENILGIFTGPCSGTGAVGGSRFMVVGKSPLTNTWGDSDCGGHFGPVLKSAGFDAILFTGKSAKPVYLLVQNGRVELKDASHLWGKDTHETDEILKLAFGKQAQIACIGPAGEKMSLISGVIHDRGRAAARSGLGALMGSKNLKAIVVRGDMRIPVADEVRLTELRKKYLAQLRESDGAKLLRGYGTLASLAALVRLGGTPIRNWSGVARTDFRTAEEISGDSAIKYEVKKYVCHRCPLACGGHMVVPSGLYAGPGHKPEYETLAAFGPMALNDDVESIIKLNDLCNRGGLDTISAGAVIAFAIECYEAGIITSGDTDGIELRWGNAEAMVAMIRKMIRREGLGDVLSDGVRIAANRIGRGAQEFAVHCAGQEPGMHDPKCWPGRAISYQLDATPGRHAQGGCWVASLPDWWKRSLGVEDLPDGAERYDYGGKGEVYKKSACAFHFLHSSGLCRFPWYHTDPASAWEFVSAVTGWDIGREEVYTIGERIANMRQAFNIREGFNALDHPLHSRMVGLPPPASGPTEGVTLSTETLLKDFLSAMDWDPVTARPSLRVLIKLGLHDVADDLQNGDALPADLGTNS